MHAAFLRVASQSGLSLLLLNPLPQPPSLWHCSNSINNNISANTSSALFIITIIIIVIFCFEPPFGQIKFRRELCILACLMPF